jgi:hypothetical protein
MMPAGTVLQVVQDTVTTTFTTTSSTFVDITGYSASITPRSSSSQILAIASINGATSDATSGSVGGWRLVRTSTAIAVGTSAGSRTPVSGALSSRSTGSSVVNFTSAISFLDSPNTSSAVTYKAQAYVGAGTLFINRTEDNTDAGLYPRPVCTLTLLEIAG